MRADSDPEVLFGIRRNDIVGHPIRMIDVNESRVRQVFKELRKWARRDFRDHPEIHPQLVRSNLKWKVVEE